MERSNSSLSRWLLIGLAIFLFIQFGAPLIFGNKTQEQQPLAEDASSAAERTAGQICKIQGDQFTAELSTQGASLRHVWLSDPSKYYKSGPQGEKQPLDLVTITSVESRMPLRTNLRSPVGESGEQQVPHADFDWLLSPQQSPKSCTFTYEDSSTKLTKTIAATGKPYELLVELTVHNRASEPRKHRLAIEHTAFRTRDETKGSWGLIPEWITETIASTTEKTERQNPDAFEPGDFKDTEFTAEKWRRTPGDARFVATASSYYAQVAIPIEGPVPFAETLIEERWDATKSPNKDHAPDFGHIYRSRLAYPEKDLQPNETTTYKVLSYTGPKEREVLASVGKGLDDNAASHDVSEVINLGWFSPIAKVLVGYLYWLYDKIVGSWGWAICLLTITVRTVLFPLTLQQIKSTAAMRTLKPEMDEINAKYKDDATQRGLALQELWRKNKVANPVVGCVPVLLQMPVWFALYTALQTAVELYHTPFGPLIPDLAAPDKYHIIPFVLGGSSFLQQKLMPMQGDAMQQKMMMYMMPAIFTAMMFFLPAGLGVYMLTNTWLGIGQQVLVERYLKRGHSDQVSAIEVREKTSGDDKKSAPSLGKGKARVRG